MKFNSKLTPQSEEILSLDFFIKLIEAERATGAELEIKEGGIVSVAIDHKVVLTGSFADATKYVFRKHGQYKLKTTGNRLLFDVDDYIASSKEKSLELISSAPSLSRKVAKL